MDSFYGGHQGTPFIIKHAFTKIGENDTNDENTMIGCFRQGTGYKPVWFGEYCIIDTPNKNDPDNGKIYRRGTEYSQGDGDAVYIGQIVGPAGPAPIVEVKSVNKVIKAIETSKEEIDGEEVEVDKEYQVYPIDGNKIWYDQDGEYDSDKPPIVTELTINELVPGHKDAWDEKVDEETTIYHPEQNNPSIKFAWCNIKYAPTEKNANGKMSNKVLVGFEIPYVVFKAQADLKSPYNESGKYQVDEITNIDVKPVTDDETHEENPFYQEFTLPVYKGVPGISYSDFRVVYIGKEDSFYTPNDIVYHGGDNPYLTIKDRAEKITPAAESTIRFYGYVVRISAYDTYNDPHALEEIAQTDDDHKDFYIKAVDTTDFEPEELDKYGIQNGRIRSIWLYLGQKVESGKGSVAIVDKNTYSNSSAEIWSQLVGVDNAAVVTYTEDKNIVTPFDKSNKWWEAGFNNSDIFYGGE